MTFKNFLKLIENGDIFPTGIDYAQVPNELGLPLVKKTGRIDILLDKKNPIYIQLSDGTKLFLTIHEFERIKNKPEIGKKMMVVFQRRPNDNTSEPSQIKSITVF